MDITYAGKLAPVRIARGIFALLLGLGLTVGLSSLTLQQANVGLLPLSQIACVVGLFKEHVDALNLTPHDTQNIVFMVGVGQAHYRATL